MKTFVAVMFTVALCATSLSCNVNDYCLNCGTDGDGGMGSGDGDANDGGNDDAMPDANCTPTGAEQCDGEDNDCNGLVDDGVLPQVGALCDVQQGVCAGGTKICEQGELKCDKVATPEICDGLDNNCNGTVDEGDPGGGGKCGTDLGECVAGTLRCQGGAGCDPSPGCTTNCCLQCDGFIDTRNMPEMCNGRDDDCDNMLDEGLTNLGPCTWPGATDVGECNIGVLTCEGGAPVCPRAPMTLPPLGAVFPTFEQCNGLDDDCDGDEDEIFDTDTDPNNCKDCGTICPTPSKTCINATNNGATCMADSDCMGTNPARACVVNSQRRCAAGVCGFQCNVGFVNDDGVGTNGCEYKCSPTGAEECDGQDNDCDGEVDENLNMNPPPGLCRSGGECGVTAPNAMCTGAGGWVCPYPNTVEFPEVSCDGKNNDCDANIDEAPLHAQKGQSCAETIESNCTDAVDNDFDGRINDGCAALGPAETGNQCTDAIDNDSDGRVNDGCPAIAGNGQCRAQGELQCNAGNPTGPLICSQTVAGLPSSAESCDAKDNDCDGTVDEGSLLGQEWVSIGGGKEMMKYEASKPDALPTDQGNITNGKVCSRSGVLPWTNISYPQALAACQSIGATLCAEQTWHRACSSVSSTTFPLTVNTAGTLFEAEDYTIISHATGGSPSATRSWVPDYSPGFSSISGLEATPNSAAGNVTSANAPTQAPRLAYTLNFPTTSTTYRLYLKMFTTANNSAADTVHVAIASSTAAVTPTATVSLPAPTSCSSNAGCSALPGTTCVDTNANGTVDTCTGWVWVDAGVNFNVNTAGNWTVNVYMGDDGAKIDQLYIRTGTGTPPQTINTKGNTWAYGNTYDANSCNGDDFDTNSALTGDQDDIVATGSRTACLTTAGVFDLSGNVKEWTLAHQPGENPIRGGASNNTDVGISCPLNFTLADDSFFFPNIGFRCCRPSP